MQEPQLPGSPTRAGHEAVELPVPNVAPEQTFAHGYAEAGARAATVELRRILRFARIMPIFLGIVLLVTFFVSKVSILIFASASLFFTSFLIHMQLRMNGRP